MYFIPFVIKLQISFNAKFDCFQSKDISREAKILLGIIYLKYWSNESQRKDFLQILYENEKKYKEVLKKNYDLENVFIKKRKNIESMQQENLQMM